MAASRDPLKLVLATKNTHKIREIKELLKDLDVDLLTFSDVSGFPDVIEDGVTFKENALKKATAIVAATGHAALADDSGLEVDALNGAPGVYSARFSGTIADDRKNTEKLLRLMRDIPPDNRGAQFRCVMAVVFPDRDSLIIDEKCRGLITRSPAGENGFGYDPVFYYPAYHKTFAQVDMGLKNQVSHRGKAIRQVREKLQEMLS